MQPTTTVKILPSNWRKFTKPALQELYVEKVIPWLGGEMEEHQYLHWNRDHLIVELENYIQDVKANGAVTKMEEEDEKEKATCPNCKLGMVPRKNRLTGEWFFGCQAFPTCRGTLSLSQAEQQKMLRSQAKAKAKMTQKKAIPVETEEMNGPPLSRAVRTPVPDQVSWEAVSSVPSSVGDLSQEELEMIQQLRANKAWA